MINDLSQLLAPLLAALLAPVPSPVKPAVAPATISVADANLSKIKGSGLIWGDGVILGYGLYPALLRQVRQ